MRLKNNGVNKWVQNMIKADKEKAGFLNAKVVPFILEQQKQRFATGGESEGQAWAPLKTKAYENRKLRLYGSFPGGGKKILVAKGRLVSAAAGEPQEPGDFVKIVTPAGITMRIGVPYGIFLNKGTSNMVARPFDTFSGGTVLKIRDMIQAYFGGRV